MSPKPLLLVRRLAVLTCFVTPLVARAEAPPPLQEGNTLAAFSITDQRDAKHDVDASIRVILFSSDMDANSLMKEVLEKEGKEKLAQAGAVYVADISRMPGVITSLFALPSMRKRDYPMLLDREGTLTATWPRRDEQVTLITLDQLRVVKIEYLASADAIRERLAELARR